MNIKVTYEIEVKEDKWNPEVIVDGITYIKMPHGSGIDYDWSHYYSKLNLVFENSWHAMNDNGMYCGSVRFKVFIPKTEIAKAVKESRGIDLSKIWVKTCKTDVNLLEKDDDVYLSDLEDVIYSSIDCYNARR